MVGAGGAYQEAQVKAFIEPFTKETGIKVGQDSPLSYPKLKAMVDAKRVTWDAMEAYSYFAVGECGTYLEKIDYSIVDKSKIEPGLALECGVPNMKSALLLVYNTDKYGDNPPTSWKDFFDTKKFPGKRGMMNAADQGALEAALLADGVDGKDLFPLDYDRAFAKLDSIRDDTKFIATGADQEQALQNGTVDMMLAWPGRAYDAVTKGAKLKPVWNQPIFYNDVFVVPKGTKNKKAVMEFLNLVVSAEAQATLAENIAYAPINPAAKPNIDAVKKSFLPSGQDNGTGVKRDDQWWADNLVDATERWTKWSAG
jgi:putative spermidine/putrescine transport system substrate-binding protein